MRAPGPLGRGILGRISTISTIALSAPAESDADKALLPEMAMLQLAMQRKANLTLGARRPPPAALRL